MDGSALNSGTNSDGITWLTYQQFDNSEDFTISKSTTENVSNIIYIGAISHAHTYGYTIADLSLNNQLILSESWTLI
jgi:hypothetical protein